MKLLNRWNEAVRMAISYRDETARYIAGEAIAPWTVTEAYAEVDVETAAVAA